MGLCIALMTTSVYSQRRYRHDELTPLNEATSARYRACRGSHVPSGQTVRRSFPVYDRDLKVCGRCGVPYGSPAQIGWTSK